MAGGAKRLPVSDVPKQGLVAAVRHYMINHAGGYHQALGGAGGAQRMSAQEPGAGALPAATVSAGAGRRTGIRRALR